MTPSAKYTGSTFRFAGKKGRPRGVLTSVSEDLVGDTVIRVERDAAGLVTFTDLADGSVAGQGARLWLAWYAFYPDTEIYALAE